MLSIDLNVRSGCLLFILTQNHYVVLFCQHFVNIALFQIGFVQVLVAFPSIVSHLGRNCVKQYGKACMYFSVSSTSSTEEVYVNLLPV